MAVGRDGDGDGGIFHRDVGEKGVVCGCGCERKLQHSGQWKVQSAKCKLPATPNPNETKIEPQRSLSYYALLLPPPCTCKSHVPSRLFSSF